MEIGLRDGDEILHVAHLGKDPPYTLCLPLVGEASRRAAFLCRGPLRIVLQKCALGGAPATCRPPNLGTTSKWGGAMLGEASRRRVLDSFHECGSGVHPRAWADELETMQAAQGLADVRPAQTQWAANAAASSWEAPDLGRSGPPRGVGPSAVRDDPRMLREIAQADDDKRQISLGIFEGRRTARAVDPVVKQAKRKARGRLRAAVFREAQEVDPRKTRFDRRPVPPEEAGPPPPSRCWSGVR